MVATVLIDLYDTLVTAPWDALEMGWAERLDVEVDVVRQAHAETATQRGTGALPSRTEETAAVISACGRAPEPRLVADLVDFETEFLHREVVLFSDALETLGRLRRAGVATSIISNCSSFTSELPDRLGLRAAVDAVVLSFELGSLKPAPGIYRHALATLGAAPSEALFVDDHTEFLDGARRLGISTRQMIHHESRSPRPETSDHLLLTELTPLIDLAG